MNTHISFPENITDFLTWLKTTTEQAWSNDPADSYFHGAKWLPLSDGEIDDLEKKHNIQFGVEQAESFDLFFEKFSADPVFQKSRIKFPLRSQVYDVDSEKEVTSTTDASKWEFFNIKQLKQDKKYIFKTSRKKEQYVVNVKMEDTGVYIDYIFERQRDIWTLVKIVDQST